MSAGTLHKQSDCRNTQTKRCLVFFVSCRRKGTFFVSQVVLTPKASTVMKGVASGLRETITERFVLSFCVWQGLKAT